MISSDHATLLPFQGTQHKRRRMVQLYYQILQIYMTLDVARTENNNKQRHFFFSFSKQLVLDIPNSFPFFIGSYRILEKSSSCLYMFSFYIHMQSNPFHKHTYTSIVKSLSNCTMFLLPLMLRAVQAVGRIWACLFMTPA